MAVDRWDAVVVGAGPAGCAVAAGLAGGDRRVLLIEAGPGEPRPSSVTGLDVIAAAEEPTRQWPDLLVRDGPDGQLRPYRQGLGLGGGSMINALLLSPGDRRDYRRWEERYRCAGWGPDDMDPWLTKASDRIPGAEIAPGPLTTAFAAAAVDHGHPIGGSSMDQDRLGLVAARLAIDGEHRRSAVEAYLEPPYQRSVGRDGGHAADIAVPVEAGARLTVWTGRTVQRILMDGDRAAGVELIDGRRVRSPLVVLCAGAVATPRLLCASGLNRRPVGHRLKDHPSFAFTVGLRASPDRGRSAGSSSLRSISRLLRWSSGPDEQGDLQAFVIERVDREGDPAMAVVVVGLMRVDGAGSVPSDGGPTEVPAQLTGDDAASSGDRRRLARAVTEVHRLLTSDPLSSLVDSIHIDDRGTPADALMTMSEAQLHRWLSAHPGPYAHPAGTCAMGPESDPDSVTSCEPAQAGLLLGYHGIHVADASIMPDLVQGGLQLPVMALAERVTAGLLAADR